MSKFSILVLVLVVMLFQQSCKNSSTSKSETATEATQDTSAVVNASNKQCFLSALNRDTTTVSIEMKGDSIFGEMIWNPFEKDGAVGTLVGVKTTSGEFDLMYHYMIEGSLQSETKMMKIENGQLYIKQGELEDPKFDGNLRYKDVASATYSEVLTKVECK